MSTTQGRKIAMVGATGTVGSHTLSALLQTKVHTITAITRSESTSTFPSEVTVKKGSYTNSSFLASALAGQDVLILQLARGPQAMESQVPLIEAAAKAGVRWVLPTEFGSDPYASLSQDFPMAASKKKYRDLVEDLGMSWVAVVNNPWFDWSLKEGLWNIDIPGRKATILDVGDAKFNTTSLGQVGRGVAQLLSLPDGTLETFKNKPVYLRSFLINQRDILTSVIRATGTKDSDWEITIQAPEIFINALREAVATGNMMAFVKEFYAAHMQAGRGGNYQDKAARHAEVLALGEESLDDVVKTVVEGLEKKD